MKNGFVIPIVFIWAFSLLNFVYPLLKGGRIETSGIFLLAVTSAIVIITAIINRKEKD